METFTLTAVVLLFLNSALIIWSAALLLRVEFALDRLRRLMNPSVRRDHNGRRTQERI